ncbi:MAG: hypothetical protein PHH63_01135 [Bacteroidales bacterium]|jgi:hypothetical protein|nr:hypothetical protein [Bacteroidales bacterium]MDD3160971.1 hypothetical protein [Bacteroidales bacterium]
MNNRKSVYASFAFLVALCFPTIPLLAQQSSWKTEDGWALRKAPGSSKYEKFFAVGVWNIPGYNLQAMEENQVAYRVNAKPYLDKSPLYNLVYLSPGKTKYAKKRVEVTGSITFQETLKAYLDKVPGLKRGIDSDYVRRQYLNKHIEDKNLEMLLDSAINNVRVTNGDADHIWAPIDEIVNGGAGSGWCWHPSVGKKIKERIKKQEMNTLVYCDLVGIARGNAYLFERKYLQTHDSMPATVPYDALGKDAKIMENRPLLGFLRAHDGRPVYDNGTADYTNYDLETLKSLFYENLMISAAAYKGSGDVFGSNTFIDFNTHPVLAGTAVDGIKAGVGEETPVWLYFDGNGYAKPSNLSAEDFAQLLKCQIYTSIIHGATGIMFWNDRSLSPEVFYALEPVLTQLNENIQFITMNTLEKKADNDLHYMIKKDKGRRYVIASNTSMTESIELNIPNGIKRSLKPLEVLISPL